MTDIAGNASSCSLMTSYTHDGNDPTVTVVSSTKADGTYGTGTLIPITVTFSENVYVTGTPRITLETGATDAVVNYTSGSGTNTLTFNYTVGAGEASADLNYESTGALVLNSGTIKDLSGNNANLALPALASANSLAGQKAIVLDQTAPTITFTSINPVSPGMSQTPTLTLSLSEAATVTLYTDSGCSAAVSSATALASGAGQTITTNSLNANVSTSLWAKGVDLVGNVGSCSSMVTYVHDSAAPTVSTFARAGGSPTNSLPVNFTLTFNEPINPASLTSADFTNAGTATGVAWSVTNSGNNTTFTVAATVSGNGTLQPRLASGGMTDVAGNANASAVTATNSVSYSVAAFSVAINHRLPIERKAEA